MKIGIDFDGVISDSTKLKQDMFMERFGIYVPAEYCSKDRISAVGISGSQYSKIVDALYQQHGFLKAEPVLSAKESIDWLIGIGHEVHIITSRNDTQLDIAKKWLSINNIDYTRVVNTNYCPKADYCIENRITAMLDDSFSKLQSLAGKNIALYLFMQPYNAMTATDEVIPVHGWARFLELLVK